MASCEVNSSIQPQQICLSSLRAILQGHPHQLNRLSVDFHIRPQNFFIEAIKLASHMMERLPGNYHPGRFFDTPGTSEKRAIAEACFRIP